jgi:membrane-associated phospholipid phosphatase
MLEWICYT